jgi:hypothetical protein
MRISRYSEMRRATVSTESTSRAISILRMEAKALMRTGTEWPLGFSNRSAGPPDLTAPVGEFGDFEVGIDLEGDALQFAGFIQRLNEITQVSIGHLHTMIRGGNGFPIVRPAANCYSVDSEAYIRYDRPFFTPQFSGRRTRSARRRTQNGGGAPVRACDRLEFRLAGPAQYRMLGKTGMKVPEMGFGCMITSDPSVIERAADMGVNFFGHGPRVRRRQQ